MRRRLVPYSTRDRIVALVSLASVAISFFDALRGSVAMAISFGAYAALGFFLAYGIPDQPPPAADADDYSMVIERIAAMGAQLGDLDKFLKQERAKIASVEATVQKLREERSNLEPVVATQRETVEAILAAHASRMSSTVWKERVYGFVIGAVASLIATFFYDYMNR